MGRIILSPLITLDGVIEAPGGEPGFKYTGWSGEYFTDEYLRLKCAEVLSVSALLLGRKTYEGFAEAWPERTDDIGFADQMNSLPKYVVTTTLPSLSWNNSHIISTDVPASIVELKRKVAGDILVVGSGTLVQTLLQHDLVDEFRLMVHPTMLGIGTGLYRNIGERKYLRLTGTAVLDSGIVILTYIMERT
jgi:dihydrofolate reductase